MRILIYTLHFHPEPIGIGKYTGEMASWLGGRGHDVRVVTAPPFYPEWRVAKGFSALKYKREIHAKLSIWRCPIWVPQKPTSLRRLLHLFFFAVTSGLAALGQIIWKPDLVLAVAPSLLYCPTALFVARMSKAVAWLHLQDFEIDAAFATGQLKKTVIRKTAGMFERWLIQRFDRVSTISASMIRRLKKKGIPESHCVLFPNWVDLNEICPLESVSPFKRELKVDDGTVVALYSGTIGKKQGLEVVLAAARLLHDEKTIVFIICGEGAAKGHYQAEYGNVANVKWLPLQPPEKLNQLLNLADIHLLPQLASIADAVMPSKLTGMLASCRPIIATAHPGTELSDVVSKCGVVVPPGDPYCLRDAILQLASDRDVRVRLGQAARRYAALNIEQSKVLLEFEKELIKSQHEAYVA